MATEENFKPLDCLFVGDFTAGTEQLREILFRRAVTLKLKTVIHGRFCSSILWVRPRVICGVYSEVDLVLIHADLRDLRNQFPDSKLYVVAPFLPAEAKQLWHESDALVHSNIAAGFIEVLARCIKEGAALPSCSLYPHDMIFEAYKTAEEMEEMYTSGWYKRTPQESASAAEEKCVARESAETRRQYI